MQRTVCFARTSVLTTRGQFSCSLRHFQRMHWRWLEMYEPSQCANGFRKITMEFESSCTRNSVKVLVITSIIWKSMGGVDREKRVVALRFGRKRRCSVHYIHRLSRARLIRARPALFDQWVHLWYQGGPHKEHSWSYYNIKNYFCRRCAVGWLNFIKTREKACSLDILEAVSLLLSHSRPVDIFSSGRRDYMQRTLPLHSIDEFEAGLFLSNWYPWRTKDHVPWDVWQLDRAFRV